MAEPASKFDELIATFTPEKLAESQRVYTEIVARYYGDPDFRAEVDANPTVTLKAAGLEVPEGASVKLLFNSEKLLHIVLPVP